MNQYESSFSSRTPDRDSVVFTHLTYLYQPVGKIKNEQSHAGHTSIRDVIVRGLVKNNWALPYNI